MNRMIEGRRAYDLLIIFVIFVIFVIGVIAGCITACFSLMANRAPIYS
jgi:hypothetical protein